MVVHPELSEERKAEKLWMIQEEHTNVPVAERGSIFLPFLTGVRVTIDVGGYLTKYTEGEQCLLLPLRRRRLWFLISGRSLVAQFGVLNGTLSVFILYGPKIGEIITW